MGRFDWIHPGDEHLVKITHPADGLFLAHDALQELLLKLFCTQTLLLRIEEDRLRQIRLSFYLYSNHDCPPSCYGLDRAEDYLVCSGISIGM